MAVIDFHAHCLPDEVACQTRFFREGWSDLDGLLRRMDDNGIERSVLLYPTTDAHLHMGGWSPVSKVYNQTLAQWGRRYEDRLIPAAIVSPEPDHLNEILSFIENEGFKALSLASSYDGVFLDDERFWPLYEKAQDLGWIIHIHPQILDPVGEDRIADPLLSPVLAYMFDVSVCFGKMMMAGVFDTFANLCFVFAHYGGVVPWLTDRFDNTYQMLRKRNFVKDLGRLPSDYFKNVYFDTAGNRSSAVLKTALEAIPAEKILFGSDHPAQQDMGGLIRSLQQGDLTPQIKNKIFYENAAVVLEKAGAGVR